MTLARALSKLGSASRSQARELIEQGRVRVNGRVVKDADAWVDLSTDRLALDDAPVRAPAVRCVMLNKPTGVVTTRADERGRRTVFDLLGAAGAGLKPVGRLDLDTSGLLLLTSDTRLADRLTDPKYGVAKVYEFETDRPLTPEGESAMRSGVDIRLPGVDHHTKLAVLEHAGGCRYRLTLTEGKNRQVRRMVEAVGTEVIRLERVGFAGLKLGSLPPREWRELKPEEIEALRETARAVGPGG